MLFYERNLKLFNALGVTEPDLNFGSYIFSTSDEVAVRPCFVFLQLGGGVYSATVSLCLGHRGVVFETECGARAQT
jgi:hypothetical protein